MPCTAALKLLVAVFWLSWPSLCSLFLTWLGYKWISADGDIYILLHYMLHCFTEHLKIFMFCFNLVVFWNIWLVKARQICSYSLCLLLSGYCNCLCSFLYKFVLMELFKNLFLWAIACFYGSTEITMTQYLKKCTIHLVLVRQFWRPRVWQCINISS